MPNVEKGGKKKKTKIKPDDIDVIFFYKLEEMMYY